MLFELGLVRESSGTELTDVGLQMLSNHVAIAHDLVCEAFATVVALVYLLGLVQMSRVEMSAKSIHGRETVLDEAIFGSAVELVVHLLESRISHGEPWTALLVSREGHFIHGFTAFETHGRSRIRFRIRMNPFVMLREMSLHPEGFGAFGTRVRLLMGFSHVHIPHHDGLEFDVAILISTRNGSFLVSDVVLIDVVEEIRFLRKHFRFIGAIWILADHVLAFFLVP